MHLQLNHIHKSFEGKKALKNISFSLKKGNTLALIGESGCGKSTILRIIAGLTTQDEGSILLNNQSIHQLTPEKRNFGFVFQNLALFPHLKVKDNITFGLKQKGNKKQKLEELLSLIQLEGFGDRFPHELSGGQQQRVAIARSLANSPEVLLLDEPFSSLDEVMRAEIRQEIFEILKPLHISTILVSHHVDDTFMVADDVVLIKNGEILQKGTPKQLYENAESLYAAKFFGKGIEVKGKCVGNTFQTNFGEIPLNGLSGSFSTLFARNSDVSISDETNYHIKGLATNSTFLGEHWITEISALNSDETITISTQHQLPLKGKVYFLIASDGIKFF